MKEERGNVSIAALGLVSILAVLLLGLGDLSAFLLARSRAQTAADASALAAAAEKLPGSVGDPHSEAVRFAVANGARLIWCDCSSGSDVTVKVAVLVRFALLKDREVRAAARAGADLERLGGSRRTGSPGA